MPKKPFDERLAEIEAALPREDTWERPTETQRRRIEQRVGPVTYPPSSAPGRRWTPAGVVLVLTAFGAMCVTAGGALGPLFMKPDLTGYVKEERLKACETRLDERGKSHEAALDNERDRTSKCYDKLGACQSQQGAKSVVIESYEESLPKSRRMPRVER